VLHPGFGPGFSPGSGPGSGLEVLARRFWPRGSGPEVLAGRFRPEGSGPEVPARRFRHGGSGREVPAWRFRHGLRPGGSSTGGSGTEVLGQRFRHGGSGPEVLAQRFRHRGSGMEVPARRFRHGGSGTEVPARVLAWVHICANFATCSWEPLAMINLQFVAGEHGLFGGHKSEDIRTFFFQFWIIAINWSEMKLNQLPKIEFLVHQNLSRIDVKAN